MYVPYSCSICKYSLHLYLSQIREVHVCICMNIILSTEWWSCTNVCIRRQYIGWQCFLWWLKCFGRSCCSPQSYLGTSCDREAHTGAHSTQRHRRSCNSARISRFVYGLTYTYIASCGLTYPAWLALRRVYLPQRALRSWRRCQSNRPFPTNIIIAISGRGPGTLLSP